MQQDAEIISVLKELYNISGCRMSLYDTHLREIAAYPDALSPFCALVRQNKHADHLCRRQDAVAFEIVRSQGQIYIYRCPFGLHEAVAPLYQYEMCIRDSSGAMRSSSCIRVSRRARYSVRARFKCRLKCPSRIKRHRHCCSKRETVQE